MELLPGSGHDALRCNVRQCTLSDPPTYEALSYTWKASEYDYSSTSPLERAEDELADEEAKRRQDARFKVHCDDKVLFVGAGLHGALKRLRGSTEPRALWVDQICIDQSNLNERSTQVRMMRHIYSGASRVILWAGEEDQFTEKAFEVITKLSPIFAHLALAILELMDDATDDAQLRTLRDAMVETHGIPMFDEFVPTYEQVQLAVEVPPQDDWKSLPSIFNRPVFTRIWIVQEICCAKKAVVMCGSHTIGFIKLAKVAMLFANPSWSPLYERLLDSHDPNSFGPGLNFVFVGQICGWRLKYHQGWQQRAWCEAIEMSSAFQATDPRDKIFAWLGAAKHRGDDDEDDDDLIIPDYRASVQDVFMRATQAMIQRDKSINILYRVQDRSSHLTPGLPSWVPDYVLNAYDPSVASMPMVMFARPTVYTASGSTTAYVHWPLAADPSCMATRAYHVDTITRLTGLYDLAHCGRTDWEWSAFASSLATYPTGEELASVFWRTCVANRSEDWAYPASARSFRRFGCLATLTWMLDFWGPTTTPELTVRVLSLRHGQDLQRNPIFQRLIQHFHETNGAELDQDRTFTMASGMARVGRQLYITERGYMGLCRPSVKEGDEVHIISGGPAPFILRPAEDRSAGDVPCYTLMGDCYHHGIMDGEATQRDDFQWREIYIR